MITNIYLNTAGEYYYASKKEQKQDVKTDEDVSTEYAFNYCSKMNFKEKTNNISKKQRKIAGDYSGNGKIWKAENHERSDYLTNIKKLKELKNINKGK
jgi:phosphopentomutase